MTAPEDTQRLEAERLAREIEQGFDYNGQPNGPPVEFEAVPFSVWRRLPRLPKEELLGPLIVRGQRLVFGAATGEGKSTIIWWIMKALATGGSFLGWKANRPCRVLVVDAEQGEHDLERLMNETHLGDADNCYLVHVPDGLALDTSEEERLKLDLILREGKFDVVILDPLYKLHQGDPNDERQAVALMKLFDHWRIEYNFALVIPSHMRKPQGKQTEKDFTMHDIFGASAYLRGAETVIGVRLIAEGRSQLYFFKSRSPGLPVRTSWMLRYDRDLGFSIYESGASKIRRERDEAIQVMRAALEEVGGAGCDIATLMEETGRSRRVVFDMLKEIGADSMPMPGHPSKRLYFAPGQRPSQADMDVFAVEDEDE